MTKDTAKKAPEVLVLELVHSSKSQFVMDGPGIENENADNTHHIQFPSKRNILTTSKVMVYDEKLGARIPKTIRYIAGCPFIDPAEQEARGYKPNYLTDTIQFIHGRLTVIKDGNDVGKFLFLKACSGNTSAENRPDDAIDVFKEIRTEIEAGEVENNFDIQLRAMNYVGSLKRTDKQGVTVYEENQIAFLCALFKFPAFETGFKSEAYVALQTKAQTDSVEFLNKIGAVKGRYQSDVAAAVQKGIISLDGRRAFFTEGQKFIMTMESDLSRENQLEAIADFMADPKHQADYKHLTALLEQSVNEGAGIVN